MVGWSRSNPKRVVVLGLWELKRGFRVERTLVWVASSIEWNEDERNTRKGNAGERTKDMWSANRRDYKLSMIARR